MALNVVIVEAKKNAKGDYQRPNRYTAKPEDIKASGVGHAQLTGYKSHDTIPDGLYYVGFFDPETKQFLGQFTPMPGFTVQ